MFETKKQLKEKIKYLEWDIEELKITKDIAVNQVKMADGEVQNAKAVADYWKARFENVEKIIQENEKLKTQIKINNNYIKKLEKEVLIQRQTLKNKDEYISILHNDATLYTTMKTRLQNNQLKDKLNRISAIVNED